MQPGAGLRSRLEPEAEGEASRVEPPGAPVHGPRMCAGTLRGPVAVFPSVSVAGSDPALCAHDLSAPQLVRSSVPDRPLHAPPHLADSCPRSSRGFRSTWAAVRFPLPPSNIASEAPGEQQSRHICPRSLPTSSSRGPSALCLFQELAVSVCWRGRVCRQQFS